MRGEKGVIYIGTPSLGRAFNILPRRADHHPVHIKCYPTTKRSVGLRSVGGEVGGLHPRPVEALKNICAPNPVGGLGSQLLCTNNGPPFTKANGPAEMGMSLDRAGGERR